MTQTKVLEVSVRIAARPETIFPFSVDPKLAVRWMGTSAKLDPRPGGVYDVNVTGRDIARGEFVEVVPNSRVVFTWGWDNEDTQVPPGSTTVEITLVPRAMPPSSPCAISDCRTTTTRSIPRAGSTT